MTTKRLDAFEPADSQSVGTPSADLVSDVGSNAPGGAALAGGAHPRNTTDDSGSVEGVGGERASARGPRPLRGGSGAAPPSGAPPGAPSSLDTFDTTRAARERFAATTADWVRRVGEKTERHRSERAREHRRKARRRIREAREQGFSEIYAHDSARWHNARARGHEERIARVLDCGVETLEIVCSSCGKKHERRKGCRSGLLCLSCRGSIAAEKRGVFLAARDAALREAKARGLLLKERRGGRWSEKFLTLTAPHVEGDTVLRRIERVRSGWSAFLRRLNKHWRAHGVRSAEFFRCLEWTPGSDGLGHPHVHVWIFSPYLLPEHLRAWWRDSLLDAGLPGANAIHVIIDIRERYGERDVFELIKYLTKDITSDGTKLDPELYALVYEAFDGRRVTQASSGFMRRAEGKSGCECGSTLPKRVSVKKRDEGGES